MSKILVVYVLSLLGFPIGSQPAPAPADPAGDRPAVVAPHRADAVAVRRARPPRAVKPAPQVEPDDSAKTDAGTTTPTPTSTPTPAVTPTVTPTPAAAAATAESDEVLTAEQIIARVQALYDGTTSFQANFRQVFRHRLNPDRSKEATGVVYLQKPGKMRWEYQDPERKLIVSDGSTLWAYEPEEDQVFEQTLEDTDLPSAVSFLLGSGSLSAEFDVRLVEEGSDTAADRYVLELRPKVATSHYSRLLFVVSRADFQVVRTVVIDHSGNTNSIEFAGIVLNGDIPASRFRFVRPEGARVIR
jgi:outer membrane lipoprotein carrier protein